MTQRIGEALTVSQLPQRVKVARERRGLSQRGLALAIGYDYSAIAHIEAGRKEPSVSKLRALATELGVTTDYLLGMPAGGSDV